jgi:acetoin utilization protein AcuC
MLLVFGPRSATYDFGPDHPLTPRRFGPGIDLLRAVGAEPGLAPEPAPDEDLAWCHSARFIETVRAFSRDPFGLPAAGIADGGDVPPFAGMHEAGAMVAGGSLRAVEAILRGGVEHAFHPGGGLHHAMRDRASGFCIYDDPALAIARARRDGLRVLYVDLDVHHGDGVQAIHWDDPGVLTISFHETGRYLFPGTGFVDEIGEGRAAGTAVNVPLEPGCGEGPWLDAVRSIVPPLAAAFGPDLVVSQHGADSHAWDPLAHLRVTTTAMGEAARIVDAVAHRWAGGRWLATGGGGYDAYRVVPRAWALTWLAGAHREAPDATPEAWRDRWAGEAARYGQAPLPERFDDLPNAGAALDAAQEAAESRSAETVSGVVEALVPALLRVAIERGWWTAEASGRSAGGGHGDPARPSGGAAPAILDSVDAEAWARLRLASRVVAPANPATAHAVIGAALADTRAGVLMTAAVAGDVVTGVCLSTSIGDGPRYIAALGVAPLSRGQGLAATMLARHLATPGADRAPVRAVCSVAERDPFEPLDRVTRAGIARRLFERAGFEVRPASARIRRLDPLAAEFLLR